MSNAFSTYGDNCICLLRSDMVKCTGNFPDTKPSLLIWYKPKLVSYPTSQHFVILKTWNIQITRILIIFIFKLTIFPMFHTHTHLSLTHTYFYLTLWKQIQLHDIFIPKYFIKHHFRILSQILHTDTIL